MGPRKYSRATLELLCWPDGINDRLPWHELKETGLYLADEPFRSWARRGIFDSPEREVVEWHPRRDPELPALPLPFSARELAAFFLAGGGTFLLEPFENDDVPDEEAMALLGENGDAAREVLREACRLRKKAVDRFGHSSEGTRHAAEWLLDGAGAPTEPQAEPVAAEPVQSPERTLKTGALADAFNGIMGVSAQQWRNRLGDLKHHLWLTPARATTAAAPTPATWWPLKFAELLLEREASAESLNRAFLTVLC